MTSQRRRAPKRGNLWLPFNVNGTITSASSGSFDLLTRYLAEHGSEIPVGTTLGPIIGELALDPATVGSEGTIWSAIFLAPEGVTPGYALEAEQLDGMWYLATQLNRATVETAAGVFEALIQHYPIMTRAMRKITEIGQQLLLQVDEITAGGNVAMRAQGHIFMKLP